MISQRRNKSISALMCFVVLVPAGSARGQFSFATTGYPSADQFDLGYGFTPYGGYDASGYASGYGFNPFSVAGYESVGGYGSSPYGYGVSTGRMGMGYQSAGRLYNRAYQSARPGTTTDFQPLYNMITALPGWTAPGALGALAIEFPCQHSAGPAVR